MDWGWRLPFIFALVPGLVAVWGRQYVPETRAFLSQNAENDESDAKRDSGIREVMQSHCLTVLIGIGSQCSFVAFQYGGFIWTNAYLRSQGLGVQSRMSAGLVARVLMILLAFPAGWLGDCKGVAWVTFAGAVLVTVSGLPIFAVLQAYPTHEGLVILVDGVCFALVGASIGTVCFHFVPESFPAHIRGVGVGLSFNIGFACFGGLAPVVMQEPLNLSPLGPGIILSACGLITASTLQWGLCMRRKGLLKLAY